jgi:hypothetical protein
MDAEVEEAAVEQRAIVASFKMQHHDRAAQELMATERRATAARLAEDHTAAHANAHRRNIEAVRAVMAEAERRLFQADMAIGLAKVAAERQRREHQYPLLSFNASAQRAQERHTFISSLEEAERDRHQRAAEENRRCREMVSGRLSDDGAGLSTTPPPAPSGASVADATGEDSDEDHLF